MAGVSKANVTLKSTFLAVMMMILYIGLLLKGT